MLDKQQLCLSINLLQSELFRNGTFTAHRRLWPGVEGDIATGIDGPAEGELKVDEKRDELL